MKDRVRSGRPRNVRTRELKAKIKKIIVRSARRSMRKMSRDFGISSRSIGRVVHDDQGGAPAHTANTTQQWFRDQKIDFISKELSRNIRSV